MCYLRTALPFIILFYLLLFKNQLQAQQQVIDSQFHYLRNGIKPEWKEFARVVPQRQLTIYFTAQANEKEQTLRLRQYDVKQRWKVLLNDHALGTLTVDENDMITYLVIPAGTLLTGSNKLQIEPSDIESDDIRIGPIQLYNLPLNEALSEASITIEVVDKNHQQTIPARITIVNHEHALQTVGAATNNTLAVRPGFVYTGSGKAVFGLPAGTYTIYATRGFEYGVDSAKIIVKRGDQLHRKFVIRREVPTDGWVSSDTHIHTLTYSKHGDATIEERALTIAGEGIELPITTEHNITTDLKAVAKKMNVSAYFTPVMGMEWTTSVGHFNLFPLSADAAIPDHQLKNWNVITDSLNGFLKNGIVILNHARDIHNDFRPFDPRHHIAIAGLNVDGWNIPANAMEVINSGSQQTDPMRLLYDWFGMLNRGYFLTPAGSSDSHDVGRYLVGQARTYIRCADKDAGQINIKEAVQNFKEGKVMVSFGLLTEIRINNRYGPGELVPASDKIKVSVRVLGPKWIKADGISLYANGVSIRGAEIKDVRRAGMKWQGTWVIPRPKHDIFLVAVAEGPGTFLPFWPIAKPYQPATPEWSPRVMGISGAVWIDGDKNGQRNSAYSYAKELINDSNHDINRLVEKLAAYDKAVTIQAAALLAEQGWTVTKNELINALNKAQPATKIGFLEFISEWEKAQPKNRE